MGWVGTRSLPAFDALLAPLLIDSYDLEQRVFDAGIPMRMADGLRGSGLTAISVLPGPLRKIMGVDRPFVRPADFSGQTIATDTQNAINVATVSALGATPVRGASGMALDGVDGLQTQSLAIVGNGFHNQAQSVTANMNFWPRPLVILIGAERFAALTPDQRDALFTAGEESVAPAMQASREEDATALPQLCASPMAIVDASDQDLAQMRSALEPVYDGLRKDVHAAAFVDEIAVLKMHVGAPPETLTC
jgi:TRAP-type C4-dicarboxylate transport system substrate-binding protein